MWTLNQNAVSSLIIMASLVLYKVLEHPFLPLLQTVKEGNSIQTKNVSFQVWFTNWAEKYFCGLKQINVFHLRDYGAFCLLWLHHQKTSLGEYRVLAHSHPIISQEFHVMLLISVFHVPLWQKECKTEYSNTIICSSIILHLITTVMQGEMIIQSLTTAMATTMTHKIKY